MKQAAASSSGSSASTPGGQTRIRPRFERKSDAERAAKKTCISAAHPITPTCELDRWGQTLMLLGMSYEDKSLLHQEYVRTNGHIMANEPYVTYSGSKTVGQNNFPHYPLSASKADAYVPKMPVTSLQHALDVVEVCKLKWPKCFFKPLVDNVGPERWPTRHALLLECDSDQQTSVMVCPVNTGVRSTTLDWQPPFLAEFPMFKRGSVSTDCYKGNAFVCLKSALGANPDIAIDAIVKFWERYNFEVDDDKAITV